MEIHEALEIVRKLADGLHPETAEPLHHESLFQLPQTVRALNRAVLALEFQEHKLRPRRAMPQNSGKPWSDEEDARLLQELRTGIALHEIASKHSRRVGSVVARLMRLRRPETAFHKGTR